ncbi:MAG: ion channel, partial [Methanobacteriaceae archaeon]
MATLKLATIENILIFDAIVSFALIVVFIYNRLKQKIIKNKRTFLDLKRFILIILALIPYEFIILTTVTETVTSLSSFSIMGLILVILRIIHIIALLYSFKKMGSSFVLFTRKAKLDYGIVLIILTFLIGSYLFFGVEHGLNPEVATFEDSLWYTVVSMTTTGYGDI